jgi:hypothetical protein
MSDRELIELLLDPTVTVDEAVRMVRPRPPDKTKQPLPGSEQRVGYALPEVVPATHPAGAFSHESYAPGGLLEV